MPNSNILADALYSAVRSVLNTVSLDDCKVVLLRHLDISTELQVRDRLYELSEELIKLGDRYIIRNKDSILGVVDWSVESLPRIVEDFGLPKFISSSFVSWVEGRTPPKHRANI